jgi:glycerophosphoryl diester phosphodiesterase
MNRMNTILITTALTFTTCRGQQVEEISNAKIEPWPIVIAHRGASGYLPEHTLESAAYAHALGADYIEQDCVLSKDNIPVVLHDITLDRVTDVADQFPDRRHDDGHWYAFDFTLEELLQLNVNERYAGSTSTRFPRGKGRFQIATLQEQIELIQGLNESRGTSTGFYVELKQPARHQAEGLDLSVAVLKVLQENDLQHADDRVFLQCFEEKELQRLRVELNCRLPLIQLLKVTPGNDKIREYARYVDGLGLSIGCVFRGIADNTGEQPILTDVVNIAHQHALQVHVWTLRKDRLPKSVDSAETLLGWLVQKAGADGVFTDHPDVVVQWREEVSPEANTGPFRLLRQQRSRTGAGDTSQ